MVIHFSVKTHASGYLHTKRGLHNSELNYELTNIISPTSKQDAQKYLRYNHRKPS